MTNVEVRGAGAGDWRAMREVRLAALRESPRAFASTYQREAAFTEADWQRRITAGATFLAYAGACGPAPVGIAGGFEAQPGTIEMVSVWVSPDARGLGAGQALVEAVLGWARAQGAGHVHLWVTQTNDSARRLYERCGFRLTGERQPLPSRPELTEVAMAARAEQAGISTLG
jgi:ribosomal protein S18 acetylase RimI-like enzyme